MGNESSRGFRIGSSLTGWIKALQVVKGVLDRPEFNGLEKGLHTRLVKGVSDRAEFLSQRVSTDGYMDIDR